MTFTLISPEISYEEPNSDKPWRASIVCERDGNAACPGIDELYATREEAESAARSIAEDYYNESVDQGDEVELGELKVVYEPSKDNSIKDKTMASVTLTAWIATQDDDITIHLMANKNIVDGWSTTATTLEEARELASDMIDDYLGEAEEQGESIHRGGIEIDAKEVATIESLNSIMTTSEAEAEFGLAEGTAKKAAQRGSIPARKSGGTWLIRREDAKKRWGTATD